MFVQPIENFGTQAMIADMTADSLGNVSDQSLVAFLEHEALQVIQCQAGPSVFITGWGMSCCLLFRLFFSCFLLEFDNYNFRTRPNRSSYSSLTISGKCWKTRRELWPSPGPVWAGWGGGAPAMRMWPWPRRRRWWWGTVLMTEPRDTQTLTPS